MLLIGPASGVTSGYHLSPGARRVSTVTALRGAVKNFTFQTPFCRPIALAATVYSDPTTRLEAGWCDSVCCRLPPRPPARCRSPIVKTVDKHGAAIPSTGRKRKSDA